MLDVAVVVGAVEVDGPLDMDETDVEVVPSRAITEAAASRLFAEVSAVVMAVTFSSESRAWI